MAGKTVGLMDTFSIDGANIFGRENERQDWPAADIRSGSTSWCSEPPFPVDDPGFFAAEIEMTSSPGRAFQLVIAD